MGDRGAYGVQMVHRMKGRGYGVLRTEYMVSSLVGQKGKITVRLLYQIIIVFTIHRVKQGVQNVYRVQSIANGYIVVYREQNNQ